MDKIFISLVVVFFAAFTLFISTLLRTPLTEITRAQEDKQVSVNQSIIFGWPPKLKADGRSSATITVFIRNSKTEALSGKQVNLISSIGNIVKTMPVTDKDGRAVFQLSSANKGIAQIEAVVDNMKLAKKISINFE